MTTLTRRRFLQAAGGITFMALLPNGLGAYADPSAASGSPLFIVPPYIQPGPGGPLVDGRDTLVVAWQTDYAPSQYEVTYGPTKAYGQSAAVVTGERVIGKQPKKPTDSAAVQLVADQEALRKRLNYFALLPGLSLGQRYFYRVQSNGKTIVEGFATTRKAPGRKIRFVSFGDNSFGDISDRAIAYYTYAANPDFVMNAGDNVYDSGLDDQYARYFFPAYNADFASIHSGAPVLRSIPFYTIIANHDVAGIGSDGGPAANFDSSRDALGFYTFMHMPLNGPAEPKNATPTVCTDAATFAQFTATAGERFPRMANYSFDYGDVHFLCLDSNDYVDPTDSDLQAWIDSDLSASKAIWKTVVYHHPPFNVGENHYAEQHMRALCPLLEKRGVDIVISGHEHTYQRTMPLHFAPTDLTNAAMAGLKVRTTPGDFTVDRTFDGVTHTRPNGIIYITTGAGGKELYDPGFGDNPALWKTDANQTQPYVARFYSRSHSLTIFDVDGRTLNFQQMTEFGEVVDRVTVTKA